MVATALGGAAAGPGVPVGAVEPDPEQRLYDLAESEGDLAHARYDALRGQVVSFANTCHRARVDR